MTKFILHLFFFLGFVSMAPAQTTGPEKGWLIIDGGGEPIEVQKRFVALAGGSDANFVLIPTAMSDEQSSIQRFAFRLAWKQEPQAICG